MKLFYTPDIEYTDTYNLDEAESKHAIRVLRLKKGDSVTLVNGKGTFYKASIAEDNPKNCVVSIEDVVTEQKSKPDLQIAIAPTKNNDRTEWFIEKCTEIGIFKITPLRCKHSERKQIKRERLQKTAIAAMKQSLKATLPQIQELTEFDSFIQQPFDGKKYIAHCDGEERVLYKDVCKKQENNLILIGPEGDFSTNEVKKAIENGFESISFGESRLRTETAGVVACTIFNMINE